MYIISRYCHKNLFYGLQLRTSTVYFCISKTKIVISISRNGLLKSCARFSTSESKKSHAVKGLSFYESWPCGLDVHTTHYEKIRFELYDKNSNLIFPPCELKS